MFSLRYEYTLHTTKIHKILFFALSLDIIQLNIVLLLFDSLSIYTTDRVPRQTHKYAILVKPIVGCINDHFSENDCYQENICNDIDACVKDRYAMLKRLLGLDLDDCERPDCE